MFPLDRFDIADASEMVFQTVVKRGDALVRYVEALQKTSDGEYKLRMDFDGFQEKVTADQYLTITDNLHVLISAEFERSIKEPLIEYMRKQKGG